MQTARLIIISIVCTLPISAQAKQSRSQKPVTSFKYHNPCPGTGERSGRCPGYIVDHIIPLCDGGADAPENMQWQTTEEAKIKDQRERQRCRAKN